MRNFNNKKKKVPTEFAWKLLLLTADFLVDPEAVRNGKRFFLPETIFFFARKTPVFNSPTRMDRSDGQRKFATKVSASSFLTSF